jgi:hypothetical protein
MRVLSAIVPPLGTSDKARTTADFLEVQTMPTFGKATIAVLAAVFAIAMTTFSSLAASDFEGVWKVKDTAGKTFEITLSSGGAAKASRGEGMVGTWKEEGNTAVITWNTGCYHEDRERARSIQKNCLRQRPAV